MHFIYFEHAGLLPCLFLTDPCEPLIYPFISSDFSRILSFPFRWVGLDDPWTPYAYSLMADLVPRSYDD